MTTILLALVDLGAYVVTAPQADIFEDIVCKECYRHARLEVQSYRRLNDTNDHSAPERNCSINLVQTELAFTI